MSGADAHIAIVAQHQHIMHGTRHPLLQGAGGSAAHFCCRLLSPAGELVEYRRMAGGGTQQLLRGKIASDGNITCFCSRCQGNCRVPNSVFEEHAGSKVRGRDGGGSSGSAGKQSVRGRPVSRLGPWDFRWLCCAAWLLWSVLHGCTGDCTAALMGVNWCRVAIDAHCRVSCVVCRFAACRCVAPLSSPT